MTQFPQSTQPVIRLVPRRERPVRRAVAIETPLETTRPARPARRGRASGREQLAAAAASVVWFAGWFQSIYDEIRGEEFQD